MFRRFRRGAKNLCAVMTAGLLLTACGPSTPEAETPQSGQAAPVEKTARTPVLVMLGDSLTAGFGVAAEEALPAVIERQLVEEGVNVTIVNAGVSGDTTADALNRYDFSVGQANPDLLVVALGANDYLNGLDPKTALGNLNRLLDRAVKDEIPVALVGVSVPDGGGVQPEFEAAYKAIYPDLARSYGAALYPNMLASVAGRPDLLQDDGLHPTRQGIELIASDMAPFLKTFIMSIDRTDGRTQP